MSFLELELKPEYRSFESNIIKEFYLPVLDKAVNYKRAVGYFSSTALIEITKGIKNLIKNEGKIQIIASPQLSKEDIEAIEEGYKGRDEVIVSSLMRSLDFESENIFEKKRLNLLAHLIKNNILDIKIAFINTDEGLGIYHEKTGVLEDSNGNVIVFSGSLNETGAALTYNYEAIDVYCSWKGEEERIKSKVNAFNRLWNNNINEIHTIEFPEIAKEKIEQFIFEEPDLDIDYKEQKILELDGDYHDSYDGPKYPPTINLRDYQREAIEAWEKSNFRGIFDMATGTGKTITGLSASTELFNKNNQRLAIIIVCPYQHLVEQWVEDINLFDMKPIIGYSSSKQKNWRSRLKSSIKAFNYKQIDHFCFVTTNATFSTVKINEMLNEIDQDLLLLIDEAHNFGARHFSKALLNKAEYRLALSATIERHNDEEGTNILYNYFGDKCIEYTLEDAIENDMLTPYEYYPVEVCLSEDERTEYKRLTYEISRRIVKDRFGKVTFKESAKKYLIERARLVAGIDEKLLKLKELMKDRVNDSHMLVYCGATTITDIGYEEGNPVENEIRQVEAVSKILGFDLNMDVAKFTSKETNEERARLIERFEKNDFLQTLIAIRCLDEGVNIPSIRTAFILASSTNPKEYIQRRGRVLRLSEGKSKAIIYDFITLPVPINEIDYLSEDDKKTFKGLIKREVERMKDFANIALNSFEADSLIYNLEEIFSLEKGDNENDGII